MKKNDLSNGKGKCVKPNPCINTKCQNKCPTKLNEEDRLVIFKCFWSLDFKRKRDYLLSCVKQKPIKRKRVIGSTRRSISYDYYICHNSIVLKVCQQFLLKTLDISQKLLRYTIDNRSSQNTSTGDNRGRKNPKNKTPTDDIKIIDTFISHLPAVPSHYCRNKSNTKYLPAEFRNIANLYNVYQDYCKKKNKTPVSHSGFRRHFNTKYSIGFHLPKKDKCRVCEKEKDIVSSTEKQKEIYQNHILSKNNAKAYFLEEQKKRESDPTFLCASFDLEKVLNTPMGDNMNFYYSRKYSQYNLTIYESTTRRALCYLWGEGDANRGCNEIATCIQNYLMDIDEKKTIKTVSLFCDSCCGQNKNHAMIGMLHHFIEKSKHITTVKITYLVPGHTYMPVDAIHATIDNFLKHKTIWAPSEWPTIIACSRKNPGPLEVITMKYNDFFDWKSFSVSNLPKQIVTDHGTIVKITKIKSIEFCRGEKTKFFFDYTNCFETTDLKKKNNIRNKTRRSKNIITPVEILLPEIAEPKNLYTGPREISSLKYLDLLKLCSQGVIPTRYHEEYKNLKYNHKIADTLPDTDKEDGEEED